jgi:hypothetical protein
LPDGGGGKENLCSVSSPSATFGDTSPWRGRIVSPSSRVLSGTYYSHLANTRHPSESWAIPVVAAALAVHDTPAFAGVTDWGRRGVAIVDDPALFRPERRVPSRFRPSYLRVILTPCEPCP